MYFTQQTILQSQLMDVRNLFVRYSLDTGNIEELAPLIGHFEIRLPFIGAFSCGKSSLINALIEESLLSTEITPETAVATELRYGKTRSFTGHLADGKTLPLAENAVRENQLSMLLPEGWLSIELPSETLATTPHLVLVDMPGWSSGVEAHKRVIDDYADRSLAYVVVVSVEEGTLRETLRRALLELAVQNKPLILAISKAHKKADDEAAAVAKRYTDEITQLMGRPPLGVAMTSAAKRDTAQLRKSLTLLESRAQDVFGASVVNPWRGELQRAAQNLKVLASKDFADAALISAEIESFEQQMREFDERLVRETEGLEERIGPMLGAIRVRVENALAGRLDAITERALDGGNVSDDILGTARLVVAEALKEEFEPTVRRYLDRLVDALPSRLDFNFSLSPMKASASNTGGEFRWKGMAMALAPLLAKIPHPLGKIAAVVLPILATLFDSQSNRKQQELDEARQRERAKGQVRSALTQAAAQIESQLHPVMQQQVKKVKEEVAKNIATERADIEMTLTLKRKSLEEGEAQAADLREKAQADLRHLEKWLAEIR